MRILHTSDWHLGQKFINQSRDTEQALALDWLLQTIREEAADTLIVAGDIFDVANPPVGAEELYYRFLTGLKGSGCRHVVVVGGNHDSPARLNAPRGLLRALDVHVVGCATDDLGDEIIELKDAEGRTEALVAAVPFLRDRDFRQILPGESANERVRRIQEGITAHYREIAARIEAQYDPQLPVIATGHLYAKGASAGEEQQNIYIGNLENISAEQFPERFDYIALGHIHRPQKVGKKEHIRYCGSLIPLSFSEIKDRKIALIVELGLGKGLVSVRERPVPVFRRLVTLRGSLSELSDKLPGLPQPDDPLPAWVELIVEGDAGMAAPDRYLREKAAGLQLDILKIRYERGGASSDESATPIVDLAERSPEEVFLQRCESKGLDAEHTERMRLAFIELKAWAAENADALK